MEPTGERRSTTEHARPMARKLARLLTENSDLTGMVVTADEMLAAAEKAAARGGRNERIEVVLARTIAEVQPMLRDGRQAIRTGGDRLAVRREIRRLLHGPTKPELERERQAKKDQKTWEQICSVLAVVVFAVLALLMVRDCAG